MRVNIREILRNPEQRRRLLTGTVIFLQAMAGITTTRAQAERAVDAARKSR